MDGLEQRILEHSLAVNLVGETNVSSTYIEIVKDLNLHFRHKSRLDLLKSLDEQGVEVHLCGLGWEMHEFENHKHLGQCDFDETREHMKNAKILLDNSPFHPIGLHERFLYGAISGAAIATDHNMLKNQIFENEIDAILYDNENLNSLGNDLRTIISNDSWKQIALAGQKKIKAGTHGGTAHPSHCGGFQFEVIIAIMERNRALSCLQDYFSRQCKPDREHLTGVEFELFALNEKGHSISFSGENGIETFLTALSQAADFLAKVSR